VDHSSGTELVIDLEENVLRMGFHKDAVLPYDLGPALEDRNHDLFDDKRLRLGVQALYQRWIFTMLEIAAVEREVGDEEPFRLVGMTSRLSHQKPPIVAALAVGEAEDIRKVGEPVELHVRHVPGSFDAVVDVLPPEPAVEP